MLFTKENIIDIDVLNEILKCFYLSTSISVSAYDNSFNCLANYTNKIEEAIEFISINRHFHTITTELQKKSSVPEEFIFVTDELHLTYAVIGLWNHMSLHGFVIAGPINYGYITKEKLEKSMQSLNLPVYIKPKLIQYFHTIPQKDSISLRSVCKILLGMITSSINYFKILAIDTINLKPVEISLKEYIYPSETYQNENKNLVTELIRYTKSGNKEMIQRLLNNTQIQSTYFSKEFSHALDNHKSTVTWMLNLFALPLIEVGINVDKITEMIAYYLNAIVNCKNATELTILTDKMINDFLDEAAFNKETDFPLPVNKAMFYIHHHLSEDLSLQHVAKIVHMSPKYFSRYFKQQTGVGFREYINEQRIKKAKDLLDFTNEELHEIALSLGFRNQSYFTTVFKKNTGTTPNKYRNKT